MLKVLIAPLLGGIIGYVTNDLAIKMLFRPRNPIYIGKFHVPFTPGLIPRQKSRIAKSIGKVISEQLLNLDTLKEIALSEQTIGQIREKIGTLIDFFANDSRTISELLELRFSADQINSRMDDIEKKAAEFISDKLIQANIRNVLVESIFNSFTENEIINKLTAFFWDSSKTDMAKQKVSEIINRMVEEKAPDLIFSEIEKNKKIMLETPINELCVRYLDKKDTIIDWILGIYITLVEENMEELLKNINVEKIVVDKINSFDAIQLEDMIFGIMRRELKAIVYLGAGIGFFMGFINLLF
ncbi:MAG: DUF445 domain-containing protein [Oliverpabstia sp.]